MTGRDPLLTIENTQDLTSAELTRSLLQLPHQCMEETHHVVPEQMKVLSGSSEALSFLVIKS